MASSHKSVLLALGWHLYSDYTREKIIPWGWKGDGILDGFQPDHVTDQIGTVPDPASISLIGLGLAGLVVRVRP